MAYALNKDGRPLMPTKRRGKAGHLLKDGMAKAAKLGPSAIQLLYGSAEYTQPIALGADAGSKAIGISAAAGKEESYCAEVKLKADIVDLLSARRAFRSARRNRKARYREPRFSNRVRPKHKGWLAPSIEHKIQTRIETADNMHKILPTAKVGCGFRYSENQKSRHIRKGLSEWR
ncbi:MAG: RRXRR domain-containing protein, partial [Clostridiales bacterium]|nr:RRXRR domain-containing protein [Clostridiales bacterium]